MNDENWAGNDKCYEGIITLFPKYSELQERLKELAR